jgi:hypothetical protein
LNVITAALHVLCGQTVKMMNMPVISSWNHFECILINVVRNFKSKHTADFSGYEYTTDLLISYFKSLPIEIRVNNLMSQSGGTEVKQDLRVQ